MIRNVNAYTNKTDKGQKTLIVLTFRFARMVHVNLRAEVDEMREEMTEELAKIGEDMQMSATLTTEQTGEEEAAAVPEVAYSGIVFLAFDLQPS